MSTVLPEELSALLDGELDARREHEIRIELDTNAELRGHFEALQQNDIRWRKAAAGAAFTTATQLSVTETLPTRTIILLVSILLLVRFISKWLDIDALTWGLHIAALIAVLATTAWLCFANLKDGDKHVST